MTCRASCAGAIESRSPGYGTEAGADQEPTERVAWSSQPLGVGLCGLHPIFWYWLFDVGQTTVEVFREPREGRARGRAAHHRPASPASALDMRGTGASLLLCCPRFGHSQRAAWAERCHITETCAGRRKSGKKAIELCCPGR